MAYARTRTRTRTHTYAAYARTHSVWNDLENDQWVASLRVPTI